MPDTNDTETLRLRAEKLMEVGRYQEAIPLLLRAHGNEPQSGDILCLLSYAYVNLQQYPKALEWADQAVGNAPEEEWGHRLRSVILLRQGKPILALQAALEAVRLAPEELFPLSNLAEAYILNGQREQARDVAERLLSLHPEVALTHRTRAFVQIRLREYAEAEASSLTALHLEPENARSLRLLGDAQRFQKRGRESLDTYAESLKRDPTNGETRVALQEAAMEYLGWPWGPPMAGALVLIGLLIAGVNFSVAMMLGFAAVWAYGWATVRHGLPEVWADNPRFTELPENTRNMIVDVCRAEGQNYLRNAFNHYRGVAIALLILIVLIVLWRGENPAHFVAIH